VPNKKTAPGQHWLRGLGKPTPANDISPNFFTTSAAQGCKIGLVVIADKLKEVAHVLRWRLPGAWPVDDKIPEQLCNGAPRAVDQRSGTRRQRLKAGDGAVDPHPGEIREGCGAFLAAIGWRNRGRYRLPKGGRRSRCRRQ
jgi:hypothetical protein